MAPSKDWIDSMRGVPYERRKLYLDIRDNVNVLFSLGIKQPEEKLDAAVKAFQPGTCTVAGIQYHWRLARFPYYVEWQFFNQSGNLTGTVFQMVLEWEENDFERNRKEVVSRLALRKFSEQKTLAGYIIEAAQDVRGNPVLSHFAARALGKAHFERQRQIWQTKIIDFLKAKSFTKANLDEIPIPLCQLLAELYNEGQVSSEYLSLTWNEYDVDSDLAQLRELRNLASSSEIIAEDSQKKKRRKNRKKKAKGKGKEGAESDENTATGAPDSQNKDEDTGVVDESAQQASSIDDTDDDLDHAKIEGAVASIETDSLDKQGPNESLGPSAGTVVTGNSESDNALEIPESTAVATTSRQDFPTFYKKTSPKGKGKVKVQRYEDAEESHNHLLSFAMTSELLDITKTSKTKQTQIFDQSLTGISGEASDLNHKEQFESSKDTRVVLPPPITPLAEQQAPLSLDASPTVKESSLLQPGTITSNKQQPTYSAHQKSNWSKTLFPTQLQQPARDQVKQVISSVPLSSTKSTIFAVAATERAVAKPGSRAAHSKPKSFLTSRTSSLQAIANHTGIKSSNTLNTASVLEFPALEAIASASSELVTTSSYKLVSSFKSKNSDINKASQDPGKSSNTKQSALLYQTRKSIVTGFFPYNITFTGMEGMLSKKQQRQALKARRQSTSTTEISSAMQQNNQEGNFTSENVESDKHRSKAFNASFSLEPNPIFSNQYNLDDPFTISPSKVDTEKQKIDLHNADNTIVGNVPRRASLPARTVSKKYSFLNSSTTPDADALQIAESQANTSDVALSVDNPTIAQSGHESTLAHSESYPIGRHTEAVKIQSQLSTRGERITKQQIIRATTNNPAVTANIIPGISDARATRRNSIEQIRRSLERRLTDPKTAPKIRERIASISGVTSPWGLTRSRASTLSIAPASASAIASITLNSSIQALRPGPLPRALVPIPKIDFSKNFLKLMKKQDGHRKVRVAESGQDINKAELSKDALQSKVGDMKTQAQSVKYHAETDSESTVTQQRLRGSPSSVSARPKRGSNSLSILRANAPSFIPQGQISDPASLNTSIATSPRLGAASSVPMSISTSNTTDNSNPISILKSHYGLFGEAASRKDGLRVSFSMPKTTTPIKGAPMYYPPEASINDPMNKPWNRPRSRSVSEIPSSSMGHFDAEMVEDNSAFIEPLSSSESDHMEIWQKFVDDDLPLNRPWAYRELGESPEDILNHAGGLENNYRVSPWETGWRTVVSHHNSIPMDVPAMLMETQSGSEVPLAQFDRENNLWRIFPPSKYVGPDPRVDPQHPDFLPPGKLKQVQGLEVWDYCVHRSSRLTQKCLKQGCPNLVRDDNPQSMPCLGCGPLSHVRWCSRSCMFEDIPRHYKDCGSTDFYPPANICLDKDLSFPSTFDNWRPLIEDINGWRSMERHRIHLTTLFLDGSYGLYPNGNMQFLEVRKNKNLPEDIPDRLNRLLNCALLDRSLRPLISYMYLILRDLLDEQVGEPYGEYHCVLKFQIQAEWKFDWYLPDGLKLLENIKACECIWYGMDNSPDCKDGCRAGPGLGEEYRKQGLKCVVEELEKEHWILRIWRLLHPNVPDWQERLTGKGFTGVKPRKVAKLLPVMGVGWDGHISKGKRVGQWRKRLTLEAPPPPTWLLNGALMQTRDSFIWTEPQA